MTMFKHQNQTTRQTDLPFSPHVESVGMSAQSHSPHPQLNAQWVRENGRLVCYWVVQ